MAPITPHMTPMTPKHGLSFSLEDGSASSPTTGSRSGSNPSSCIGPSTRESSFATASVPAMSRPHVPAANSSTSLGISTGSGPSPSVRTFNPLSADGRQSAATPKQLSFLTPVRPALRFAKEDGYMDESSQSESQATLLTGMSTSLMAASRNQRPVAAVSELCVRYGVADCHAFLFKEASGASVVEENRFLARLEWSEPFRPFIRPPDDQAHRRALTWWWDVLVLACAYVTYFVAVLLDGRYFLTYSADEPEGDVYEPVSILVPLTACTVVLLFDVFFTLKRQGIELGATCRSLLRLRAAGVQPGFVRWCVIDVLPALPLDVLVLLAEMAGVRHGAAVHALVPLLNLRLFGIGKVLSQGSWAAVELAGKRPAHGAEVVRVPPSYYRYLYYWCPIVKGVFLWLLIAHFTATVRWCMRRTTHKEDTYFDALFWTVITLCSVGYRDSVDTTSGDKIVACFCAVLGLGMNGWLVGQLTVRMHRGNASMNRAEQMMFLLNACSVSDMPVFLQQQTFALKLYSLDNEFGTLFSECGTNLPRGVPTSLEMILKQRVLAGVPLFRNVAFACQLILASCLKREITAAQLLKITRNSRFDAIYIVSCGFAVRILTRNHARSMRVSQNRIKSDEKRGGDGEGGAAAKAPHSLLREGSEFGIRDGEHDVPAAQMRYLRPGDAFGEESLFEEALYSVKTMTCCVFYKLDIAALQDTVHRFPCFTHESVVGASGGRTTLGDFLTDRPPPSIDAAYANPKYGGNQAAAAGAARASVGGTGTGSAPTRTSTLGASGLMSPDRVADLHHPPSNKKQDNACPVLDPPPLFSFGLSSGEDASEGDSGGTGPPGHPSSTPSRSGGRKVSIFASGLRRSTNSSSRLRRTFLGRHSSAMSDCAESASAQPPVPALRELIKTGLRKVRTATKRQAGGVGGGGGGGGGGGTLSERAEA